MLSCLDNRLFFLINNSLSNKFFDLAMPLISKLGSLGFILILAVFLMVVGKKQVRRFGLSLLLGLIVTEAVVFILKIFISRPRPFVVWPQVHLLAKASGSSFPSGHTANIFMAVTLLLVLAKKFYFLYIIAFAVAISRVYLGVHFLSDCLAGAILGTIIGYLISRSAKSGFVCRKC